MCSKSNLLWLWLSNILTLLLLIPLVDLVVQTLVRGAVDLVSVVSSVNSSASVQSRAMDAVLRGSQALVGDKNATLALVAEAVSALSPTSVAIIATVVGLTVLVLALSAWYCGFGSAQASPWCR